MKLQDEVSQLKASLEKAGHVQQELDRRIFHLKTLYDVSKDIFSSVETETILRSFLLMTMGNFGVIEGFALLYDKTSGKQKHFVAMGLSDEDGKQVGQQALEALLNSKIPIAGDHGGTLKERGIFPDTIACALPLEMGDPIHGVLGLGAKIVGDPYSDNDKELLDTLANNLVVSLKNARAFEEIKHLNADLQDKNEQLKKALKQLRASMRKVEILESVKDSLSKFVPVTVSKMIEKSPTGAIPEGERRDLSVLFLDIEGYTKLCEKLGSLETSAIIEKHFSVFMDAIYTNRGDINETAGDGLMVIFLDEDKRQSALNAVRAAMSIRKEAVRICEECSSLYRPLDINMGINSGPAFVGAAKFDSYGASRWTYTARGRVTNIAARIGAQAKRGGILLSKETASRIEAHYALKALGKFSLKNVSEDVEVFEL
jgi:class 3 adenylate cyclase